VRRFVDRRERRPGALEQAFDRGDADVERIADLGRRESRASRSSRAVR
jgi:hypothetical protein